MPRPFAALLRFLRRAAASVATSLDAWRAGVREQSSSRWVSKRWLTEHELQSRKHEDRI